MYDTWNSMAAVILNTLLDLFGCSGGLLNISYSSNLFSLWYTKKNLDEKNLIFRQFSNDNFNLKKEIKLTSTSSVAKY